jgi:hypothetical protein
VVAKNKWGTGARILEQKAKLGPITNRPQVPNQVPNLPHGALARAPYFSAPVW